MIAFLGAESVPARDLARHRSTILLVTHDVGEAVSLAQRIYVVSSHPGRVMEEVAVPFAADRTPAVRRDLLRRHAAAAL